MIDKAFDVDELVDRLKIAAKQANAREQVKSILEEAVGDPEWVAAGMPDYEKNDVIMFEDDTVSIWFCRFPVGKTVPAHDHQMVPTIGVYQGAERNDVWIRDSEGGIEKDSEIVVKAGDVLQLSPTDIHSVGCASDIDSCAIHVYLGKLTTVERSLFDTKTGAAIPFDDENYYKLVSDDRGF